MSDRRVIAWAAPLAIFIPLVAVSSTVVDAVLLNQASAVVLCGAVSCAVMLLSLRSSQPSRSPKQHFHLLWSCGAALAIGGACVATSRRRADAWPVELGVLAASAAVLTVACAMASRERCPIDAAHPSAHAGLWFAWGWWVAGVLCAVIAAVQYFAPAWSAVFLDAGLLAYSTAPGRAVGNMRQPNHLATALVCAMVWTAWLRHIRRLSAAACGASIVATVFAVSLSASRTGALSLGMLLLWALVDRRLPRSARWLLALTPLIYLACWLGLAEWAAWAQTQYYGADRLQSGSDPSSSRFAIWKNAITLLAQHPWTGVGWGHFNFAWTFTPFPDRPTAFFDHTHNLPLQLAVEIGLPATVLVLGLFAWSMWQARGAWSGDRADPNREQSPARAALVMLVVLGVHSLLEYPLWYAYFLLPAAWALGLFIGSAPVPAGAKPMSATAQRWTARLLALAGVAMIAGALYALWDHRRIERIFEANAGDAPLAERIADGRRSKLFGHHADYAAVTNEPKDMNLASFRRPLLQLVDTRLLIAYIEALKATGEDRKALYAAQRLREFQRADAQAYFRDCDSPTPPFQCERAPVTGLTWRDMIPPAATNDSGR